MKRSEYQKNRSKDLEEKAVLLYKSGLTLREVAAALGMSHEWIRQAVYKSDPNIKDQVN